MNYAAHLSSFTNSCRRSINLSHSEYSNHNISLKKSQIFPQNVHPWCLKLNNPPCSHRFLLPSLSTSSNPPKNASQIILGMKLHHFVTSHQRSVQIHQITTHQSKNAPVNIYIKENTGKGVKCTTKQTQYTPSIKTKRR